MNFTLKINMDNDAFTEHPIHELRQCIQEVAESLSFSDSTSQYGSIKDINGNTVGQWEIK